MTLHLAMTNDKFARSSLSLSTCAGDSSSASLPSFDDNMSNMSIHEEMLSNQKEFSTQFALDRSDMPSTRENSPEPFHLLGHSELPSTREPSPEPYWNNANLYKWNDPSVESLWNAHRGLTNENVARRSLPRRSSREPPAMKHEDVNPSAQRYQTVLLVPHDQPVLFVRTGQEGQVMLPMNNDQALPLAIQTTLPMGKELPPPQPTRALSSSVAPAPSSVCSEQDQAVPAKSGGKKDRGAKSENMFNKMSPEQKELLCKYIYDFMVQKGFKSKEGYLIVDIFSEVWKDMWEDIDDSAEGWRAAKHRFGDLLRSAPQYFRLFRKGIRVANQCGWFARKGEKMVRLVLENEK